MIFIQNETPIHAYDHAGYGFLKEILKPVNNSELHSELVPGN